eukprot:NODE_3484_length_969_cov_18.022826_g3198_i0.p1 GENE.NODE_3484_length_969_cov_18.022826_g3198_i0~~NODE_3484_length_969_cov_18.022826_g3198_i0.p1  ORF type:complete len:216 (+),score=46.95 NODE_3484_length_969_cov_18.022826_g3198_i0:81-728(+)
MANEEQTGELEALAAIYADDFEIMQDTPPIRLRVCLTGGDDHKVQLVVEFPRSYPEVAPVVSAVPLSNILKVTTDRLATHLASVAAENVGSVMVFTLVQEVMDFLEALEGEAEPEVDDDPGRLKKPVINDAAAIRHGNNVTRENFEEWKRRFDKERDAKALLRQKARDKEMEGRKDRLTGRQYFAKMSAGIDWELFNAEEGLDDLDDLDLEDSET